MVQNMAASHMILAGFGLSMVELRLLLCHKVLGWVLCSYGFYVCSQGLVLLEPFDLY